MLLLIRAARRRAGLLFASCGPPSRHSSSSCGPSPRRRFFLCLRPVTAQVLCSARVAHHRALSDVIVPARGPSSPAIFIFASGGGPVQSRTYAPNLHACMWFDSTRGLNARTCAAFTRPSRSSCAWPSRARHGLHARTSSRFTLGLPARGYLCRLLLAVFLLCQEQRITPGGDLRCIFLCAGGNSSF